MKREESTSKKKVNRIIQIVNVLMTVAWMALLIFIRAKFDIPIALQLPVAIPLYVLWLVLFGKWLDRSRYKDVVAELDKECEQEEERKSRTAEKPGIIVPALVAVVCMLIALFGGWHLAVDMLNGVGEGNTFAGYLPEIISWFTLLLCGIFLLAILYNARRGRIFSKANLLLANGIGATIFISVVAQSHYWESTPMVPNSTVQLYYMYFAIIIFFFAQLLGIAGRIKEEQDLTI